MNDLIQEQTRDEFKKFSAQFGPSVIIPAEVVSVNTNDDTVHVRFSDEAEIDDVRLKSIVQNGNKFLLIPKVGSIVQVARIENSDELIVVAVDEITELLLVIGTVKASIDATGFLFEKGNETLKKLLDDLIAQILLLTVPTNVGPSGTPLNAQAITNIKNRVNTFFK